MQGHKRQLGTRPLLDISIDIFGACWSVSISRWLIPLVPKFACRRSDLTGLSLYAWTAYHFYYIKSDLYLQLWQFRAEELAKWEAACGAPTKSTRCLTDPCSRAHRLDTPRSSSLSDPRPKPKDSNPRSRTRYRVMAWRWSLGGD